MIKISDRFITKEKNIIIGNIGEKKNGNLHKRDEKNDDVMLSLS